MRDTTAALPPTMALPSGLDAGGDDGAGLPAVVLRLCLMAADEASGEPTFVTSLVKKISMPLALASPDVSIAVEIKGERYVFKPRQITWDEAHRVCIVEVVWLVTDAANVADAMDEGEPWPG